MQYNNEKTLQLVNLLGKIIKNQRTKISQKTLNIFAYEYDLSPGSISRIENGIVEAKITMLWRISEALGIPLSTIIKELEDELGNDFTIYDK